MQGCLTEAHALGLLRFHSAVAEPLLSECLFKFLSGSIITDARPLLLEAFTPYSRNRIAHAVCKSQTLLVQTESCGFHSKYINYSQRASRCTFGTKTMLPFALMFTYLCLFAHRNIYFIKFKCSFHLSILLQSL